MPSPQPSRFLLPPGRTCRHGAWLLGLAMLQSLPCAAAAPQPTLSPYDVPLLRAHELRAAGNLVAARDGYARLVADTNAPGALRSIAQLSLGATWQDAKDWGAAATAYEAVIAMPAAPPHHREEAAAQLAIMQSRGSGETRIEAEAGRTQLPPRPTPGRQFHVATGGSDANPGTAAQPFLTLQAARDAIRKVKAGGGLPTGGVAVVVHGGRYAATGTLRLNAEDSGAPGQPVSYRAAGGEAPVFSGGVRVEGFELVRDSAILSRLPEEARGRVVSASLRKLGISEVPPVRVGGFASGAGFRSHAALELFFNGEALPLARWPNEGFVQVVEARGQAPQGGHGTSGTKEGVIQYAGDRPARWKEDRDILLYGYWFYGWADSYERVAAVDVENRQITLAPPFHGYGYRAGQPFRALNLLSEIDQPGEWYLDRESLTLYLYPPSDPAEAVVEISLAQQPLLEVDSASHVSFDGLTWELGCTDAVRIRGGSACLLVGCTVRRFAGNGIEIDGGTAHGLRSCTVSSMGRGGAVITGGDRRTLQPGMHWIENCHIFDLSRLDRTYTPAVLLNGVGNRVSHNLFHHVPSSAMRVEGNDHLVEYNEIAYVVLESDDQGGVDMFGNPTYRGNVYRFNYFHHIGNWRDPAKGPDCGQAGIRLDDMISGTLIYGNIFRHCASGRLGFGGVQIHGGKENILDNNLFVDCATAVSLSPWGEATWRERAAGALDAPAIDRALYVSRYPDLARLNEDRNVNQLWRNLIIDSGEFLRRNGGGARLISNVTTTNALAAFPGAERGTFRFEAAGRLAAQAGFRPLPFEQMGLFRDDYRPELPDARLAALRMGR